MNGPGAGAPCDAGPCRFSSPHVRHHLVAMPAPAPGDVSERAEACTVTNNALAPGAAAEIAAAAIVAEPPIAPVIPPSESDPAGVVRTSRVVSGGLWGVGG